ncbi:hypothetical protein EV186_102484 [Labedaea rhizosphaerae]|uniref:Uncharacterized protein n=1 Tax=Labedaea rhizosphaerae TaxID=598644 RepID=A0A4R6SG33_LABRH|nr:hypothetical protein EV186_102484 [Labedaea rhizosphaerae]
MGADVAALLRLVPHMKDDGQVSTSDCPVGRGGSEATTSRAHGFGLATGSS